MTLPPRPAGSWGPGYYDECLGPLLLDPFAADLARRLPQEPPGDVLEIACGTGILTRRLRERLAPTVRLTATDLNKEMLDYAQGKLAGSEGIEWRQADAMRLPFADRSFAVVACGFGIMFMPDRHAALVEAGRVLGARGILAFTVWDRIELNPHALANTRVLEAMFPGDTAMSYRFAYEMGDERSLRELLAGAGFGVECIEAKRIPVAVADPRVIAIGQTRGTPRAGLIVERGASLDDVIDKVEGALADSGGNPYRGQAQAVIVIARLA